MIYIGIILGLITGFNQPVFGWFMPKTILEMMNPDLKLMWEGLVPLVWGICVFAVAVHMAVFFYKWIFGSISSNITFNMRSNLYSSIMNKDVGWFDDRDHASGILTTTLAADVMSLNGVSSEGIGIIFECLGSMICGIVISFIYSW